MNIPAQGTTNATPVSSGQRLFALVRAGTCVCALPIETVVETMRPLPTEPVPNMPLFVCGLSIIRGKPVPVIDLGLLIHEGQAGTKSRFVLLRIHDRQIALSVDIVLGVRELNRPLLMDLPPLLREARSGLISAIGALDQQLLLVLETVWIVPEELWRKLHASG